MMIPWRSALAASRPGSGGGPAGRGGNPRAGAGPSSVRHPGQAAV